MRHSDVSQPGKPTLKRPVRVAQPDPSPTPTDNPAPGGDGSAPTPPQPEDKPNVAATPNLTDEELAKLAEEEAKKSGKEEVIVVTGSTIERRTLTTPAPLSVLDKADIEGAGRATIGDIIQKLPANSNAINAQTNNGGDGSTRVDIRGLGDNRTLVLLNGRRMVPGGIGADASVDLNSIPVAVIERVEVLKDGASAVYGSDAIGGVVNVITRKDFDGTETSLYTGVAQGGGRKMDGFNYDMSFVTGQASKKSNILFSAGWQHQDPVFAGDRSFSTFDKDFDFKTRMASNGGSIATPNGWIDATTIDTTGTGVPDGKALCGPLDTNPICKPDGMGGWVPFDNKTDKYNYQPLNYLYTPSQRYNAYAEGHYDLDKHTKVFFEGLYINRKSDQQLASEPFIEAAPISKDSIYNNTGGDVYGFARRLVEFGPRKSLQAIDTFRVVTGLSGKLPEDLPAFQDWNWELSYNYGHTEAVQRNQGNLILSRLTNAIGPSFIDSMGVPRCGTPTAVIAGCVPMNIMGPAGSIDPAARDYVTFTGVSTGYNDQKTVLLQTNGRVVKLPNGGDISLAVGGDYRREGGAFTPDPLTSTGDTTGNATAPTSGSYNAVEGFGELSIVPISGQKLAEWVELDLAARAFHYNTFGDGVTWKAGALFKTAGGVSVRGTYSTAFRAPSVGELYSGKADNFPDATDPCDTSNYPNGVIDNPVTVRRCAQQGVPVDAAYGTSQQRAVEGGNGALKAETAKVMTAGLVFEPPPAKGLSFTVDYFRIQIDDAIQALGGQVVIQNCYTRDIDKYCDMIHRDPQLNYAIDYVDDPIENIGGTKTDGIDFAVAYDWKQKATGHFRSQFEGQYLHAYDLNNSFQVLHGVGVYDLGAYPKWKANFSTFWDHKGVNAGFNVRYIGGFLECDQNDCNSVDDSGMRVNLSRNVDSNVTGDLFAGYTVKSNAGTTRVTLGVNNLANTPPSLIYIGFSGDSDSSTYDYMGRYFYARMSQTF